MAGILQELLQAKEPLFSLAVRQLEVASGHEARDVQLIAEIAAKMRTNVRALGLDPDDTTGRELYAAQMARIAEDNRRIAARLGGSDPDNVKEIIPLVIKAVRELPISRECWVLKRSTAKKLLKAKPPKNLMKHLGYRSVDSLLKHEKVEELFAALRFSEGEQWLSTFNEQYAVLTPSDFETRSVSIVALDHKKYVGISEQFVRKMSHIVVHSKEMGVVAVVPTAAEHMKGVTLTSLLLVLHYINEVRLYSAFFKLKQVLPHFGQVVVKTLNADPADAADLAGQSIHWRVIQWYFGGAPDKERHPEAFEPHIQPEDLRWRKTEEMLLLIDPAMKFWVGQEYVGKLYDAKPLTFNLMDVARGYARGESYETFRVHHFRESLWNELFARYMGAKRLQYQVLTQLDTGVVAPEDLSV